MSTRISYVSRRLGQSFLILWAISLVAFFIMHLAPGGPIAIYEDPTIDPQTLETIRGNFGLNDPIPVQYYRWSSRLLRGDFGKSLIDSRPVSEKILERLPATIQLNLAARILGLLGIPLGLWAATKRGSTVDHLIQGFAASASAVPHWWIGLMILIFVATPTGLFPLGGMFSIGGDRDILDRLRHLVLPSTVFAIGDWVVWSRYVRSEILEALQEDYVITAYAKGLTERYVLYHHVFRNALIPVVTLLGQSLATMFSGSVALETVFSWPGIGRLAFTAAIQRDYPVMMGLILVSSFLMLLGNLFADLIYTLVDPRVEMT